MQFPLGLILIKVGSARGCPKGAAGDSSRAPGHGQAAAL